MCKQSLLLLLCLAMLLPSCASSGDSNATPTPTSTGESEYVQCAWRWATESLPDLSIDVQTAMDSAGLTGISARAEAYGENCITGDGSVDHFATMETDFRVRVKVDSLTDTADLGNLLEQILVVLDQFPPGKTPGPQPGYIGITFTDNKTELNLWFTVLDSDSARARGLQGVDLYNELTNR